MRRLETDTMILYYPEGRRPLAERFAGRVGACVSALRARALGRGRLSTHKVVLILPELPYNNAFIAPRALGYEEIGVVPTFYTSDQFSLESGLPPDAATIACHEVTHFVQLEQIEGFAKVLNYVFGEAYTPQDGFDSWFLEGLAVYYETHLQPGTGRISWPFWQGVFAAGVAGRHLDGGDLSVYDRDFHGGNNYLIGSRFVTFLAYRYGEDKLWKLIDLQARSVAFQYDVNYRFRSAFGKSLSNLIDEFAADVRQRVPIVARPPDQHVRHEAGWSARYARAHDGTEALVSSDRDAPARLRIFAPDGTPLADRDLTDVLPGRQLAQSGPTISGGLSFSPDGRSLYFVAVDQGSTYLVSRLVRFDVATGALDVIVDDLGGPGGSVSPDGRRYFFARADGDHHDLAVVDLATKEVQILATQPPGAYVAQPRVSPDGTKLVASTFEAGRFGLALFDATTGRRLRTLATGGLLVHDASWADDERVVYLGGADGGAGFQIHLLDLRDGSTKQISRAPYLAFAPQAAHGSVRFLNREGWSWTVDEIALPPRPAPPPPPVVVVSTPAPVPALEPDVSDVATRGGAPEAPTEPAAPSAPAQTAPPPSLPTPRAWPAPTLTPPVILSDAPATAHEHLLVPRLESPLFDTTGAGDVLYGLSLTLADRLEQHRVVLSGLYESVTNKPSFMFAYSNRQLAPVTLTLLVSQIDERTEHPIGTGFWYANERHRSAALQATRSFWNNPLSVGGVLNDYLNTGNTPALSFPNIGVDSTHTRLAGAYVSASFAGVESTPYTGTRRLFYASTRVAAYPAAWGTLRANLVDLRGELAFTTPLPLLRRQTLTLIVVGRALEGGGFNPFGETYLHVGGLPSSLLWRHPEAPPEEIVTSLPDSISFFEPLRGFEDHPLYGDRFARAELSYVYPFIIDRGSASTFGVLPSLFFREVDLSLFDTTAVVRPLDGFGPSRAHTAEGASLTLSTVFGSTPMTLGYQISQRRTDDRGTTQLLTLSN
jgi:WD40-like Beta Propeller Repeat